MNESHKSQISAKIFNSQTLLFTFLIEKLNSKYLLRNIDGKICMTEIYNISHLFRFIELFKLLFLYF